MKLAIILGTRPEIIKMSPVIRAAKRRNLDYFILHTGQHYSKELDEQIFHDLELDPPRYNLGVGGKPFHMQVGIMTREIVAILKAEKPTVVVVQGDTVSVLAGALAANKLGIRVAHHEAGLRSYDLSMPEETNRIITDHISDFLFVPTSDALEHLREEGRDDDHIFLTGNTIVDAVLQNLEIAEKRSTALADLHLSSKGYVLVTAHRAENVDHKERLTLLMESLTCVQEELGIPVVFPMHPRTKKQLEEFGIAIPGSLMVTPPLGFLEFLQLEKNARLVLTDSGGIQEECLILQIPCVTMRDNTERPETVAYGANMLAGVNPEEVLRAVGIMYNKKDMFRNTENPFGDGEAGERIVDVLVKNCATEIHTTL